MVSTQGRIEERLAAVETAVSEIQRRLATLPPAPDWLEQIIGSCKDEPAFEEVIALGRALRMAEPFPEDVGEGAWSISSTRTTSASSSGGQDPRLRR